MKPRLLRAGVVAALLLVCLVAPAFSQVPVTEKKSAEEAARREREAKLRQAEEAALKAQTEALQEAIQRKLAEGRIAKPAPQPVLAQPAKGNGISFLEAAMDNAKPRDPKADAKALAQRIDQLIEARLKKEGIKPAPAADTAQFWRRITLDLIGRVPNLTEMLDYLDPETFDMRDQFIENLLARDELNNKEGPPNRPDFAKHLANLFRTLILPSNDNVQTQQFQGNFENWLRDRLRNNVSYDKIVTEILTVQQPTNTNFNGTAGAPAIFFFANEYKPENLAGAASRAFLGVKLECAQCHEHPFASWKKTQFWEFAAFFSGMPNRGPNAIRGQQGYNPLSKEIKLPGTEKVLQAKFLNGQQPNWQENVPTLSILADWMTDRDNPYFAKAAVDNVWQYFFGVSLLEPIIEPQADDLPKHPELLDELAREFVNHKYDIKFLVRAIVSTKAYQRSSSGTAVGSHDYQLYARMPVRGMTPEQLFDSLIEATDYRDTTTTQQMQQFNQFNGPQNPRREFLAKFASQDKRIESTTSILQALFMMNGKFLADRVKLENNASLNAIATTTGSPGRVMTTARRVETLFLVVLSRRPTSEETARFVRYIDSGGPTVDPRQAVADVYWALLNSTEFLLNH